MDKRPDFKQRQEGRGSQLADYWPLFALIGITALAAWAISSHMGWGMLPWMHYFMGLFLCIFAMLKIFTPSAFADGFQMYDVLGKRSRLYAYVYPYIELALGLGYLSFTAPYFVYAATVIVLSFGAWGVIQALREGLDIECPCMGSVLSVPLSTVTLTEDIAMVGMALVMLFMR